MAKVSNKRLRQITRWLHIMVGVMLIVYIYTPLAAVGWYSLLVQVVAIPAVGISGVVLWQQPRLSTLLMRRRA